MQAVTEANDTDALAELLGEPLPDDWRDQLAIEGKQECLAAAAYSTTEAVLEMAVVGIELRSKGERVSADNSEVATFACTLIELDKAWRRYVSETERGDAGQAVYEAMEHWGGPLVATFVEGALEGLWQDRQRVIGARLYESEN